MEVAICILYLVVESGVKLVDGYACNHETELHYQIGEMEKIGLSRLSTK